MTREEAAQILHPDTSLKAICTHRPVEEIYSIIKEAELMGAEALRAEGKEAIIVMKTRHQYRGPSYEKPYCGACNHYVPDANAAFCCWCGAKFVTACASMSADEAEVEK